MVNRLLVSILLIPLGAALIKIGGLPFTLVVCLVIAVTAWEYDRLFRKAGLCPSSWILIGGSTVLGLARAFFSFKSAIAVLSALALVAMAYHLFALERGRVQAATDFSVTLGGVTYVGWIGSYLISLRQIPDGAWWMLTALPAVWIGDAGALVIGMNFGRRLLAPRLSPKKTWEGYLGAIVFGTLGGALLGALWGLATPSLNAGRGALLGFVLNILVTLGDLGESMIKRQAGAKDSSNLLPGHGGIFDRVDSWLWAGVISYYLVILLWYGPAAL